MLQVSYIYIYNTVFLIISCSQNLIKTFTALQKAFVTTPSNFALILHPVIHFLDQTLRFLTIAMITRTNHVVLLDVLQLEPEVALALETMYFVEGEL